MSTIAVGGDNNHDNKYHDNNDDDKYCDRDKNIDNSDGDV